MTDIVTCPNCGARNRVPPDASGVPRCGRCQHALPWLTSADDDSFAAVVDRSTLPVLLAFQLADHGGHGVRGERAALRVVAVDRLHQTDPGDLLQVVDRLATPDVAAVDVAGERHREGDQIVAGLSLRAPVAVRVGTMNLQRRGVEIFEIRCRAAPDRRLLRTFVASIPSSSAHAATRKASEWRAVRNASAS